MEWLFLFMITAFLLGFLGSLHCIGMCGPIVLALPKYSGNTAVYILSRFIYNTGRVITYILLGLVAGALGEIISLAGFQSGLSIAMGVLILLLLFTPLKKYLTSVSMGNLWKKTIAPLFKKKSLSALFAIGFLNGFLPCGLVYAAMAGAAASGSSVYGAGFMLVFGLGTIPALIAVALLGKFTQINWQFILKKVLPAAAFVLGCLLILRGLSLGIPYISPDFAPRQVGETLFIPYCH